MIREGNKNEEIEEEETQKPTKDTTSAQSTNFEITSDGKDTLNLFQTDNLALKLENLNLSSCNLIKVPPATTNFKYLRELNLSNNSLESLPKEINLYNLLVLNLSDNNLSWLPSTLKHCHQLTCLNISHNKFLEVPNVLYYGLRNIRILDLSFNEISEFNKPLECLLNITELYCSNNVLESFPNWIFSCLCKLEKLDLGENITRFSSEPILCYFWSGIFESLQYLNIENCNYVFEEHEFLSYFKNIRVLNIGNKISQNKSKVGQNYLGNFKLDILKNFSKLESLDVKNSQLSIIPEKFGGMENLKFLDASHNMLSWLPESFCNLTGLSILDLSSNQLLFLPNDINKLTNLRQLLVSNNKLCQLPDALSQLTNLEFLDIYNNTIENIDVSILKCKNLQGVDLEMNCIDFNKIFSNHCAIAIKEQYEHLKNAFRKKFNCADSRYNTQVKNISDNGTDEICRESVIYSSKYSSSLCEDDQSSDPEDECKYVTVERKESDDDWGSASASEINEDELFDPHKVTMHEHRPNMFLLKSVFHYNYCPANAHLQSVMRRRYVKVCSTNEKIEEGQFDSE